MTFEEMIVMPGREIEISLFKENVRIDLTDGFVSFSYNYDTSITGTVAKVIKLILKDIVLVNGVYDIKVKVKYDEEEQEITLTNFNLLTEPSVDASTKQYEYTLYDGIGKLMYEYEGVADQFTTVQTFFNAFCSKYNLTSSVVLVNGNLPLSSDRFTGIGYTARQVLTDIANANGCLLYVNGNVLQEVSLNNSISIDDDTLKNQNINFGSKYGAINTVVFTRSNGDSIYYPSPLPSNPIRFELKDNQMLNFNDRSNFIQGIYNKVNGFETDLMDCELVGCGFIEPLTNLEITTGESVYDCFVTGFEWTYDESGLKCVVYNSEPNTETFAYQYADTTDKKEKETTFIVDKQNQLIESKVGDGEVISVINQSPEEIKISASKLNLEGYATFTDLSTSGRTTINGANITTGSISANRISGGTFSGSNIELDNGTGFMKMLSGSAYHPYVSSLNISQGSNGISFRSGTSIGDAGSEYGSIEHYSNYMQISTQGNRNINISSGGNIAIDSGKSTSAYARLNNLHINDNGTYVWACFRGDASSSPARIRGTATNMTLYSGSGGAVYCGSETDANKIATSSSGPSSLNVKKNLVNINEQYDDIYNELKNVNAYDYDYKYGKVSGDLKKDYGFIIDEIESQPTLSKYFRNYDCVKYIKDNGDLIIQQEDEDMSEYEQINVKEWERDAYIKGLFVVIKSLQNKIEQQDQRIKDLEDKIK